MSLRRIPHFIHPKMTVAHAANDAAKRGFMLEVSWTKADGLLVVAVPRETVKPAVARDRS